MQEPLVSAPGTASHTDLVEDIIKETLSSNSTRLAYPRDHLLATRGKRLRPELVILWSSAWQEPEIAAEPDDILAVIQVAAAAELIHLASLVHDDLIDGSPMRRGRATVNSRFGAHPAVLMGDFIFARAFGLLARHGNVGMLELMTDAISAMCEGEIEQAACAFSCDETEEAYLARIAKKTSALLAACCQAGAMLAGAPPNEVAVARSYGLELGVAFQLTDDALDFIADPQELGKPTCQDLVSGVLTLPVLWLLTHGALGPCARRIIESRRLDPDSVSWMKAAVLECGGIEHTYDRAGKSLARAHDFASRLPEGPSREALTLIARKVMGRRR